MSKSYNASRAKFRRRGQIAKRLRGSRAKTTSHLLEQLEDRRLLAVAALPDQLLPVSQPSVYLSAGNISSSQAADLVNVTRDGWVDVALNSDANAWLSTISTQPLTGPVLGAATALMNPDALDDLIVQTSTHVVVLTSDAAGGWQADQNVAYTGVVEAATHPTVIPAVGYLGSDLAIDLVTPLPQSDQLAVFRGNGLAGFQTPIYLSSGGSQPLAVAVGNLIGGPPADVVVGHANGQLTFFEGEVGGSLTPRSDLTVAAAIGSISDVKIADLNSDGQVEIVATGSSGVALLSPATDPLAASPISNGNFDSGLTGWRAEATGQPLGAQAGRVQANSGFAHFTENESFLTSLSQPFVVPESPQTIEFSLLSLGLDAASDQQIPDAFEVSLLDSNSASLLPTHAPESTAFVNFVAGEPVSGSPRVTVDGSLVSLDISTIAPGTNATLVFDLIGNPNGRGSSVAIDSVRISPDVIRDDTFSVTQLAGPFANPESLAIGDVDGDGFLDLVVADSGLAQVIVFNGDGDGDWSRSAIEASGSGAPSRLALGPFTAPDRVLDMAVGLSNQAALLTPLVADTNVPTARLIAPTAGSTIRLGTLESAEAVLGSIVVQFSEAMFRPDATTAGSATNPAAYRVYNFGPDGVDDGGAGDDVAFSLTSAMYDAANDQVTLSLDPLALNDPALAAGSQYRVVALGTDAVTGLRDLAGNPLDGGQDSSALFTLNRTPHLSGLTSATIQEGQAVDLSLLLAHYNFDRSYTATVHWGDGTSTGIIGSDAFPAESFASSHVYADNDHYQVSVSVTDAAVVVASATATVTVNNDPPLLSAAAPSSSQEGEATVFTLATFSDAGFSFPTAGTSETFSATIDWDDGSPLQTIAVPATNGGPYIATTGFVQAEHVFRNDGVFFPIVTLRDDDGDANSVTARIDVSNKVPMPTPLLPISGPEGSEVSMAFFATDAGVDDLLSATVEWGDGTTTPAAASFDGSQWSFTASHFYGDDGDFSIVATITDGVDSVTVDTLAMIASEAPRVTVSPATAAAGQQLTISSIQISDPAFAYGQRQETFTASIDWGEQTGFETASVINLVPGVPGTPTTATVFAQHTFASSGVYTAEVVVIDDEGATGSATFEITVEEAETGGDAWLPKIDFDLDDAGFALAAGDIVADQWASWGVHVSSHDSIHHPPMIFDSSQPTGHDEDLGSPNQSFGGPGEGSGGAAGSPAENSESLGNILIISEDADSGDPDDNAAGGTLIFTFDNPVMVDDVRVLDIEQHETVDFRWYDAGGDLIAEHTLAGAGGSNGHQAAALNARSASRLEVEFSGSGAITDIDFCRDLTGEEVAVAGPTVGIEGSVYELDLNARGLAVDSWTINWGDGTSETVAGIYTRAEHTFGDGPFAPVISAYAAVGPSVYAATPQSLTVENVIPNLTIAGDREVPAGQTYTLSLSSSDPGADTLQGWLIDWGDGNEPQLLPGNPTQVDHTFASDGDFVIRAHAFDEDTDIPPGQSPFDSPWVANRLDVSVTPDPNRWLPTIDFERAADGSPLAAGDRITDQFASLGLTVSTHEPTKPAMIFNSADPTGGDKDLGTPNSKFGGPGKGKGGEGGEGGEGGRGANAHALGNVLIISEDNDAEDPDDNAAGGTLIFEFDSPVMMDEVHLLDIENRQTHVRLLSADGTLISDTFALDLGDNSFQVLALETTGVSRMEIVLAGSGAVAAIVSCRDGAPIPPPPTRFFVVDKSDKAAYRYSADGDGIGEFSVDETGSPRGAATTGAGNPLWVVTSSDQVLVYDTQGETLLGSWQAKNISSPEGIATDGTDIWIVDKSRDRIYRFENAASRRSGSQQASDSFQLVNGNKNAAGLSTDGQFLWVVDKSSDKVFVYDVEGNWINWWNLDPENSDPSGVTIDPGQAGLWVVDAKDDRVYSYARRTLDDQGSQSASGSFPLAEGNSSPEGIADPAIVIDFGQVVSGNTNGGMQEYSFSAVEGQEIIVDFSEARGALTTTLSAPDGTIVYSAFGFSPVNHDRGPLTLDQTGDYILSLSGGSRFTFVVVEIPEPTDYPYTLGTLTTGTTGARFGTDNYLFNGTANQEVFLRWDDMSGPAGVSLFAPDGSLVATGGGVAEANLNLGWITLPVDGEYKLSVSSSFDLTYTFVLADVPDTQAFNTSLGDEVSRTLLSIGARDHWLLEATAGERYYFDMSSIEGGWLRAKLVAPDGQVVSNRLDFVTSNHDFGPLLFDQSGTYRLELSDDTGGVPTYAFQFWSVPDPDEEVLELGQVTFGSIETPGRSDLFTFKGSQGQSIYLDMQQIRSAIGGTQALVTELVSPNGNVLFSSTDFLENAHDIGPYELPENGTYVFRFSGRGDNVANFQFQVADVTPEAAVPIAIDELVTGGISTAGEVRSYSFDATAGESLTLDVIFNQGFAPITLSSLGFTVVSPSGTTVVASSLNDAPLNIAETGSHTLIVDDAAVPNSGDDTGRYSFRVTADPSSPLPAAADLRVSAVSTTRKVVGNSADAPVGVPVTELPVMELPVMALTVTWTVTNAGPGTAQAWNDQILFSSEGIAGGLSLRAVAEIPSVIELGPGESYQQTAVVTLPAGLEGEFWVYVEPDARNTVFEDAAEYSGTARAAAPTAVYAALRPPSGSPAITLRPEDGSRYPAGSTLALSGNAASSQQSVNAIFVVDISASTLSPTGLDANFDGVIDELDDLNGDGNVGSVLDTEIAATLRVVEQLSTLTDDLQVATILFAGDSQPLDAGPGDFNQVFVDPLDSSYAGDKNSLPNFAYAMRSLWAQSSTFVNRQGAYYFRDLELASGTQFNPAVRNIESLLQSAQSADRTLVYMLTDGQAADGTAIDVAGVADQGIEFYAFQIGDTVITPELADLALAIDSDPTSAGTAVAIENPADLTTQLLTTLEVESVTVNGSPVTALDPAGNFFSSVTLTPGENTFEVTATSVTGQQTTETLTLFGDETGSVIDSSSLVPGASGLAARFSGTTFNRQANQLHARMQVNNDAAQAVAAPIVAVAEDVASSPAVAVSSPETVIDGDAAWIFDTEVAGGVLVPSQVSGAIMVAFDNPLRDRLQPAVTFLGPSAIAPVFTSVPELIAPVGAEYTYAASVLDSTLDLDGDSSLFALLQAPTGMTLNTSTGELRWTPTASDIGHHAVRLLADDGRGGTAEQQFTLLVPVGIPNNPPLILTQPPASFATVDEPFTYTIASIDPDGDPVSLAIGTVSVGSGATTGVVLQGNTLSWTPISLDVGSASIEIVATDPTGAAGTQRLNLRVLAPNVAPAFVSTPLATVSAGQAYRYLARAIDTEDAISYRLVSGPASMSIDADSGLVNWYPDAGDVGITTTVVLRATDARGLTADQVYDLTVSPDTQPPQVAIQLAQHVIDQGNSVEIQVFARDNMAVSTISLSVDGTPLSLDATGRATYLSSAAGLLAVAATATDDSGNVGSALTTLRVIDPTDMTPPSITIDSPGVGERITYLTDLLGSVIADDLEFYEVAYALAGTEDYTTFYTATSPVSGGVLATFDPTMLANDIYDLRVSAQDTNGNIRRESLEVSVEANAKIGNFRLEFTDLNIPLAGIPIQINRIYDTLAAPYSQDFGFGWSLDVASPRIRETVRISQSEAAGAGIFGANPFRVGTRVYLNAPDARRVGFTFDPVPEPGLLGAIWRPRFTADPGVYHRLEVDDVPLSQSADGTFGTYLTGFAYNPDSYTLVTKDQHRYRYNQFDDIQLQSITNRNNVTLTLDDTGIHSSVGPEINWTRDALGRIRRITDPEGNSLIYSYTANGDLESFSDQIGNVTSMSYLSNPAHYLETVADPRGIQIMSLVYDDSGRITGEGDAFGNFTAQSYDLANNREVVADRMGNETLLVFDDRGNITGATDPLGNIFTISYDADDNETSVSSPSGRTMSYTYDGVGNLTSATNSMGSVWSTTYDEFNNALDWTLPDGTQSLFGYDAQGNLERITDGTGATTRLVLDSLGRATRQIDARGGVTDYSYSPTRIPTRVSYPDGSQRRVAYNQFQQPIEIVDEKGNVTRIEYSAVGNPVRTIDALGNEYLSEYDVSRLTRFVDSAGNEWRFSYDAAGNRTVEIHPDGGLWTYTYDALGNRLSETSPAGLVTRWEYDALGRQVREIDDAGNASVTVYDSDGQVVSETDRLGRQTSFAYDAAGNRVRITYPDGSEVLMAYDANGRQTSVTDENGFSTYYEYDGQGRVVRTIDALGGIHSREFDGVGNVIRETDAVGRVSEQLFDNRNRRIAVVAADGGTTNFEYDAAGNIIQTTDPMGNITVESYDALNRSIEAIDPLGGVTSVTYDPLGNVTSVTDPLGRTEYFTRDYYDRPKNHTDQRGQTESWSWDQDGNVTAVTDFAGDVTVYTHDLNGSTLTETDPLGNVRHFSYDAEGNRIEAIDAIGRQRTFIYDPRDRMIDEQWWQTGALTRTLQFDYDAIGSLISAVDGEMAVQHERDQLGRITSTAQSYNAAFAPFDLNYTYDASGRVTQVEDGFGVTVTSGYDAAGRLASRNWSGLANASNLRVEMNYDLAGQVRQLEHYVGAASAPVVSTTHDYDAKGRLNSIRHTDALDAVLADYDFTRDAADQLIGLSHHGRDLAYEYDPASQLTGSTLGGSPQESYDYDASGNRVDGTTVVGVGNQLLAGRSHDYTYDAEGNLVTKTIRAGGEQWLYAYDFRNRLVSATLQDDNSVPLVEVTYEYDALDRRVSRTEDADGSGPAAATVQYYVHDDQHAWADIDASGIVSARYLYGEQVDALLARWRESDGLAWYLTDHLGSVRDIASESGVIVNTIDYDSFGNVISESDPAAGDRFKFTAREWDSATGLYYYRARFYDPATGRFINRDPIGFDGGDGNLYRYVANNPLSQTDPSGNQAVTQDSVLKGRIAAQLTRGFSCVGKEAAENLPELVFGGATGYLADMGVSVVSCAVNPVAGKANEFFAELIVRTKGGQLLKGKAIFESSKVGGISRYVLKAFYDCAESALSGGNHRTAAGLITGDGRDGHHSCAKKHRKHSKCRKLLAECCIGVNSALNVVGLQRNEHRGVGLHSNGNLRKVDIELNKAGRKGCAALANKLKEIARNKGKP